MTRSHIAPDPCAAVLPALAALGAIASIAAVGWVGEYDSTETKPDVQRRAAVAVQELETCCLGLAEIFRRFQRNPDLFPGDERRQSTPMKFGVQNGRAPDTASALYESLINDVAAMLVLASVNAHGVMSAVEDGEIDAPDALFHAFGECQDELNHVLQARASLKHCVDKGVEVADRLTALIRELKTHHLRPS